MTTVDLGQAIDERGVGRLQLLVFALGTVALMLDGLDNQTLAVLGPTIAREWGLTAKGLGLVFFSGAITAALIGSMLGGSLADRMGRRGIIVVGTALYGVTTLLAATSKTVHQLMIWRAVSGIGLGAVLPNVAAILAEFWPKQHRSKVICIAFGGYALGSAFGGVLASFMVPMFGWRSVFVIGGILPMLAAGLLWLRLPESIRFLATDGANEARLLLLMRRLHPTSVYEAGTRFVLATHQAVGNPIAALFKGRLAIVTTLVWVISAASLMHLVFTILWTPYLLRYTGMSFQVSVWTNVAILGGGVIGPLILGFAMDRFGQFPTLAVTAVGTLISVLVFTTVLGRPAQMAIVAFILGFCVQGFQSGFAAVCAVLYSTRIRATGLGWSMGVGRLASLISPLAGGYFLGAGLSAGGAYLAAAVAPLVGLMAFLMLWGISRSRGNPGDFQNPAHHTANDSTAARKPQWGMNCAPFSI